MDIANGKLVVHGTQFGSLRVAVLFYALGIEYQCLLNGNSWPVVRIAGTATM